MCIWKFTIHNNDWFYMGEKDVHLRVLKIEHFLFSLLFLFSVAIGNIMSFVLFEGSQPRNETIGVDACSKRWFQQWEICPIQGLTVYTFGGSWSKLRWSCILKFRVLCVLLPMILLEISTLRADTTFLNPWSTKLTDTKIYFFMSM